MKRTAWLAMFVVASMVGCGGDDRKAIPPSGPMTPPGPGAEQEGGKGQNKKANTASEK